MSPRSGRPSGNPVGPMEVLVKAPIRYSGFNISMISPISSNAAISTTTQIAQQPKPQQAPSSSQQDTVQLSPQALSHISGDADHDGDSH